MYACASSRLGSLGRAHPGRGRGRKPLSPGKGSLVGAENKKGKITVIRISGRPFPLPFPLFLGLLSQP